MTRAAVRRRRFPVSSDANVSRKPQCIPETAMIWYSPASDNAMASPSARPLLSPVRMAVKNPAALSG